MALLDKIKSGYKKIVKSGQRASKTQQKKKRKQASGQNSKPQERKEGAQKARQEGKKTVQRAANTASNSITQNQSRARTGAVGAASKGSVSNAPRTGAVRPAKTGTQRFNGTNSRSGAIGAASKGSVTNVTNKQAENANPSKLGTKLSHAGETAGNVAKFAVKDAADTTLKLIQQEKSEGKRKDNYKYVRPNAPKGSYLSPNGRYESSTVDDREKAWNKKVNKASKAVEKSKEKSLEESVKYLSDEKKYTVPENKVLNHFVPSTKSQKDAADKSVKDAYKAEYKKGKKDVTKSLKDQLDSIAKENGISDDTVLTNGMTYAEYRKDVLKKSIRDYYKEMTAARDADLKKNADVGKVSAKDIGKMGVQTGSAIGGIMIPYVGTTAKALKAADAILAGTKGGAKALTKAGAKSGAKELSESGRKAVKEYAERIAAGESRTKVMADLTKKINKSDFANNVKREALANALQDVTIGTTYDAITAKSEGKSGKDFWKYMGESAAMNAAIGAPIAGIAGRTGKAGKAALKNEVKAGVNETLGIKTLSAADRKQMLNLMSKESLRTMTKGDYQELKALRNKAKSIAINNDEIRADLNKSVELKAETLNKLSKETGVEYKVADTKEIASALVKAKKLAASEKDDFFSNGVVITDNNGKRTIWINKDSDQALGTIAGHETTHLLAGTKQFDALKATVKEHAEALGEYSDLRTRYADLYKEEMSKMSKEDAEKYLDEEITAELAGRYLFSENAEEFVKKLSLKDRNAFQKMYDYVVNAIKNATGDSELRLLNAAKANFEKAYRELGETPESVARDIEQTEASIKWQSDNVDESYMRSTGTEPRFSKVKETDVDPVTGRNVLEFLEEQEANGDYITVYRSLAKVNGRYYPPMSSKMNGKYVEPVRMGEWDGAVEDPSRLLTNKSGELDLSKDGYGYTDLKKANGKSTPHVAYNPYNHTSPSMLNDQFTEAFKRPELVVVECHVPKSELTSGYKAPYAKDSVGYIDWHSGPVTAKLPGTRNVLLSRWVKPVREVPADEIAKSIKKMFDDAGVELEMPYNRVTPQVRRELENLGVKIGKSDEASYPKEPPEILKPLNERQFDIIQQSNPADESLSDHTWIRSANDIKTFGEAIDDPEYRGEANFAPDFTRADAEEALLTGKLRVYSSDTIKNGTFVTPSEMIARDYNGGKTPKSKLVNLNDVAWIDPTEGQLAKLPSGSVKFSKAKSKVDSTGAKLSEGQQKYFADSKARDADGNLARVYHSTDRGGFTVFDPSKSDDGRTIFFSDKQSVSETYSEMGAMFDSKSTPSTVTSMNELPDLDNVAEADIIKGISDVKVTDGNGNIIASGNDIMSVARSVKGALAKDGIGNYDTKTFGDVYDMFEDMREYDYDFSMSYHGPMQATDNAMTYPSYLNMKKPLVIDGNGKEWNNIPLGQYEDSFKKWASKNGKDGVRNTRAVAEFAEAEGYDGVIFKDIYDNGGVRNGSSETSNIYAVFKPEQIKSVDNPNPTNSADIRFSKSKRDIQRDKIGEILRTDIPKEDREYVSEVFDYIVDAVKRGDNADAKAQAKALAEDFGATDEVAVRPEARAELQGAKDFLEKTTFHMPQSDAMQRAGSFDEFKEQLGEYNWHVLKIRKGTSGKSPSVGIDDMWPEMSSDYPEMFPATITDDVERFKRMAEVSTMTAKSTDTRIPIPEEYVSDEIDAMARDILDEAKSVAGAEKPKKQPPKAGKEPVKANPRQGEKTPSETKPEPSEATEQKAESIDEKPKTKRQIKEEQKEALRQDAIGRGIDVKAYDDAKVSYKNPEELSAEEINKELRSIYYANKNAKTPAHTEIRNERKRALQDEMQRRKDEQPAYASLSEGDLPENDPGHSILPDDAIRNEDIPTAKADKGTINSIANEPPQTRHPAWWQSFRRLLVNSFTGFEDLAKADKNSKILYQINNVQHWQNKFASWMEGKRSGMDRKPSGDGLNDIFDTAKLFGKKNIERRNDFINYLTYKHAIDRLAYDKPVHLDPSTGGSRYSAKDYQDMMAEIRNKYEQKGELKLLEGFEKGIRGYYDDIMKMRVDSGLVSKDLAEELKTKYPNYIPTLRDGDDWLENGSQTGGKQQFAIKDPIKKATGGAQDILDLYQATARVTKDVIRDAEQNELMRQFAEMMGMRTDAVSKESIGELPSFAAHAHKTDGGWKVSFFQDGKMVTMPVDKQIARGLREFNGKEYERLMHFASLFSKPGRAFKALITDYNIIFGVRNGARDIQQAAVNSKSVKYFTAAIPAAQASVLKRNLPGGKPDPWMEAYEANGGLYSTFVQQGKTFAEPGNKPVVKKGVDATAGKVLKSLEQVNSAIEITPRLAEFIGTIKKDVGKTTDLAKFKTDIAKELYPGKTMQELTTKQYDKVSDEFARRVIDLASTETIEKAARNASDITLNFSRNGVIGKALNAGLVPYFNPAVQGMSKTVRMFTENGGEGAKALLNFGMKLGTLTIAPAVANEILCRDNRDYQNLQTREKDSNFFIPIGDGKFIKIPKPRENAVLAEPVTYGLRYFFDKARLGTIEEGEYSQWKDLGQAFKSGWDNIGPVNPLTDNLMSPIVRLAQNKTWYGGSIESTREVLQKKDGDLKNKDIYDDTTSAWAIQLGQTKAAQAVHLSPKKIDDLMDSYLGVIYDLGVSQTAETTHGNPLLNQFVKDSVFSNKTGMELWAEFEDANAPKTTKGKVIQKGKDIVLGHSAYNINEKTQEAKDWLNQKGYDDMTYSTAVTTIRQDDSFTEKQKENIIRQWKRDQIELRRNLVYGSGEVSWKEDPIKTISKTVGVDKAMKDYTYTYVDPDTGEKKNQHLDAWKAFKKTGTYKDDKEKSSQKFVDFYAKMRWTNGKIGESKSFPQWMTASILAATEKGKNDDYAKAYIQPTGWEDGKSNGKLDKEYQEKIVQRGKNYRNYGGNQIDYRRSQKRIFEASRKLGNEYTSEMFPWDKAMALATKKGDKFADLQYYASDTSGKVSRRMNYARCLDKKGYSTKAINKFAKEYDLDVKTSGWNGDQWRAYDAKVEAAVRDKYGSKSLEEQAAIYHIITDDTYHQPFGAVGDYSIKSDTGIAGLDDRESGGWGRKGWGRRGRRGRGGWGRGGGSSGGTMPATASGAIKGKVTDPFGKVSDYGVKSNLDDAYRRKARKLAEATRKKLS